MSYAYDTAGRKIKESDTLGNSVTYTHDAKGSVLTKTDANGNVTAYAYDPLSRLTALTDPSGGITGYEYNLNGLLTSLNDPAGNTTAYEYNNVGQVVRSVSPDAGQTVYEYYSDGSLKSKTDADGVTVTYLYDEAGCLIKVSFPDPSENITYTYSSPDSDNSTGRLSEIIDPSGRTVYHYDLSGRIVEEIRTVSGITYTTSYEYSSTGNPAAVTYPTGRRVEYAYDSLNRPAGVITDADNTSDILADNFTYDPAGNLLSFDYGNGLSQSWSYNAANRLTGINIPGIMNYAYSHDPAGNITKITDSLNPSASKAFIYDPSDRLVSASGSWGNLSWTYDANGNRLTQNDGTAADTYTYNANRLMSVTSDGQTRNYQYTESGRITNDGIRELTYNRNNRLISVAKNNETAGEYRNLSEYYAEYFCI